MENNGIFDGHEDLSITITNKGEKRVIKKASYATALMALRDSLREQGFYGAFPWVEDDNIDSIKSLDNGAYFVDEKTGYCDGVYLQETRVKHFGKSTKMLNDSDLELDPFDENLRPEGYLVNKLNIETLLLELHKIISHYKDLGEVFEYRVLCAQENIELLKDVKNEGESYAVNPDKSWGDGIADAFNSAGCIRCLIVE